MGWHGGKVAEPDPEWGEQPGHQQDSRCSSSFANWCVKCKRLVSWFQISNRCWRKKLRFQSISGG